MAQVSRIHLDKDIKKRLFEIFWRSVSRLTTPQEAADFFSDLLTETEQIMLAKRYAIAVLLLRGYNSTDIKKILKVSPSTVGTVASWLKNVRPHTKKILEAHLKAESWGEFLDKIEEFLDKLPPPVYTDWKQRGKEKWQRTKARAARRALR